MARSLPSPPSMPPECRPGEICWQCAKKPLYNIEPGTASVRTTGYEKDLVAYALLATATIAGGVAAPTVALAAPAAVDAGPAPAAVHQLAAPPVPVAAPGQPDPFNGGIPGDVSAGNGALTPVSNPPGSGDVIA